MGSSTKSTLAARKRLGNSANRASLVCCSTRPAGSTSRRIVPPRSLSRRLTKPPAGSAASWGVVHGERDDVVLHPEPPQRHIPAVGLVSEEVGDDEDYAAATQ